MLDPEVANRAASSRFDAAHGYILTGGLGFKNHVPVTATGFGKLALPPEEETDLQADETSRIR